MSIDRLGGKPALPSPAAASGAARAPRAGEAFTVNIASTAPPAPTSPLSAPLAALRAGTIGREEYVRLHVEQATAHLHGMRPSDLEAIRAHLADVLEHDPTLQALVEQAQRG